MSIAINRNFAVDLKAKTPTFKANFTATDEAEKQLQRDYIKMFYSMNSSSRTTRGFGDKINTKPNFNSFFDELKTLIEESTKKIGGTISIVEKREIFPNRETRNGNLAVAYTSSDAVIYTNSDDRWLSKTIVGKNKTEYPVNITIRQLMGNSRKKRNTNTKLTNHKYVENTPSSEKLLDKCAQLMDDNINQGEKNPFEQFKSTEN